MDLTRYVWERTVARGLRRERIYQPDEHALARIRSWAKETSGVQLTICIPIRDRLDLLLPCLDSLARTTAATAVDVIIGDTGSRRETVVHLADLGLTTMPIIGEFNYSRACNLMAGAARGRKLLFLNNDTLALSSGWMERVLREPAERVVGAALVYPGTRRLQHAGVKVVDDRGWLRPNTYRPPFHQRGDSGLALQNIGLGKRLESRPQRVPVMAVTGAFLCTSRKQYQALGGFDERYQTDLQDIDYCLRAWRAGGDVVCRRDIVFAHRHAGSRGRYGFPIEDWRLFVDRWRDELGVALEHVVHPGLLGG